MVLSAITRFAARGLVSKILIGIAVVAVLGFVAWAIRVDHLRAAHLEQISLIIQPIEAANGMKAGSLDAEDAPAMVLRLEASRDEWKTSALKWRRERDNANKVVKTQSQSILRLNSDTVRLTRISDKQVELAVHLTQERDLWIDKAETASTREERRVCAEELAEAEEALDALYENGF